MGIDRIILRTVSLLLSVPLVAVSCSVEEQLLDKSKGEFTVKAGFEQVGQYTRTSLDSYRVVWNKGDKIKYFMVAKDKGREYLESHILTVSEESVGLTEGIFMGYSPTYYAKDFASFAVYPEFDDNSVDYSRGVITLPLYPAQEYKENSFGGNANVSVAKEEDERGYLKFRNICGLLKLQVTGEDTITRVSVVSNVDEPLWGTAVVRMDYKQAAPEAVVDNSNAARNELVLECMGGVPLDQTEPTAFYLALPPGTLAGGFTVILMDSQNRSMCLRAAASPSNEIKRSRILSMPVVAYVPGDSVADDSDSRNFKVLFDGDFFAAPTLTGENLHWMVYWGDGMKNLYFPGITHNYDVPGTYAVKLEVDGAESVSIECLTGVKCLDFTEYGL